MLIAAILGGQGGPQARTPGLPQDDDEAQFRADVERIVGNIDVDTSKSELTRADVEASQAKSSQAIDESIKILMEEIRTSREELNRPKVPLTRGEKIKGQFQGDAGAVNAAAFARGTDFSDSNSITTSALQTGGAIIGSAFGPLGSAAGGFIGGAIGGALDDSEDEAKKERERRELIANIHSLSQFLNASNQGLQQRVGSGQAFF